MFQSQIISISSLLISSKIFIRVQYILYTFGNTIENTEYRIQNTEYRIQNTEYRIQNTEYRMQNTECKYKMQIQNAITKCKYKIHNTENKNYKIKNHFTLSLIFGTDCS